MESVTTSSNKRFRTAYSFCACCVELISNVVKILNEEKEDPKKVKFGKNMVVNRAAHLLGISCSSLKKWGNGKNTCNAPKARQLEQRTRFTEMSPEERVLDGLLLQQVVRMGGYRIHFKCGRATLRVRTTTRR